MFEHLDDPFPPEPGDQARRAVATRSRQIVQRRRILQAGSAIVVLLAVAIPSVAAMDHGSKHRSVRTIAGPSTSTSEEPTSTSAAVTTTAPTPPPTIAPPPTTTKLACRNSENPACGPFYWDPPPGPNAPMTVQVTTSPSAPKVGQVVTFHVVVDDPDAHIHHPCDVTSDYGEVSNDPMCMTAPSCLAMYGPWTPPAKVPDHYEMDFQHTYSAAGTYTASFGFKSTSFCYPDPYGSSGRSSVTVSVTAAP